MKSWSNVNTYLATATMAVLISVQTVATAKASLYDDLGGDAGVNKLVSVFVGHLFDDPHIAPFFADVDPSAARQKLGAQFCDLAGGPCKTINPDMKKTHAAMDVTKGDFFAVLNLLRQSMDETGISQDAQHQLLDKLRPMQGEIVNTP